MSDEFDDIVGAAKIEADPTDPRFSSPQTAEVEMTEELWETLRTNTRRAYVVATFPTHSTMEMSGVALDADGVPDAFTTTTAGGWGVSMAFGFDDDNQALSEAVVIPASAALQFGIELVETAFAAMNAAVAEGAAGVDGAGGSDE